MTTPQDTPEPCCTPGERGWGHNESCTVYGSDPVPTDTPKCPGFPECDGGCRIGDAGSCPAGRDTPDDDPFADLQELEAHPVGTGDELVRLRAELDKWKEAFVRADSKRTTCHKHGCAYDNDANGVPVCEKCDAEADEVVALRQDLQQERGHAADLADEVAALRVEKRGHWYDRAQSYMKRAERAEAEVKTLREAGEIIGHTNADLRAKLKRMRAELEAVQRDRDMLRAQCQRDHEHAKRAEAEVERMRDVVELCDDATFDHLCRGGGDDPDCIECQAVEALHAYRAASSEQGAKCACGRGDFHYAEDCLDVTEGRNAREQEANDA